MTYYTPTEAVTPEQWRKLGEVYQVHGSHEAEVQAAGMGLTIPAARLRDQLQHRGYRRENFGWSAEQLMYLSGAWHDRTVTMDQMRATLQRSVRRIQAKAAELGLGQRWHGLAGRLASTMPVVKGLVPNIVVKEPVLVLADLHIPYQNGPFLSRVINLARAWGCRGAILAGDVNDFQNISKFERHPQPTMEREVEDYQRVEKVLLSEFDWLHWFLGNHEARMGRLVQYQLPVFKMLREYFVREKERVTVHDAYGATVNAQWYLEHPSSYAADVAIRMASQHLKHVAVAHTHHSSWGKDMSGQFWGIRIGAMADHDRMPYCSRITHGRYKMTNGALILVPGPDNLVRPWLLEPEMDLEGMARVYGYEQSGVE